MYQDSYREDNVFVKYKNLNINTCLQAGLGELELIPKWIKKTYPTCKLDIVEKDKTKQSKVGFNIIYEDIFKFIPFQTYDLIIIDIWYVGTPGYREEIEVLKSKYFNYLNENGIISFPMIDMHTVFSYVELQGKTN